MRLSKHRFDSFEGLMRDKTTDELLSTKVYVYEARNGLYDIVVVRGQKLVRVDMGPLSPLISDWKPIHYEIENHFNL